MTMHENVPLKDYTTFKIGGPAKYFVKVQTVKEAQDAFKWAKEKGVDFLLLGGGSNLLISDKGFDGLVVKLELNRLEFKGTRVNVGSGVVLEYLLNRALDNHLIGLEFAAGIPGTVGGAIRGNAGTFGVDMSSVIVSVSYLDENFDLKKIMKEDAKFAYRHSIFKEMSAIILEAELDLEKGNIEEAVKLVEQRLHTRRDTHPQEPSAGCMFKNVPFDSVDLEKLKEAGVEIEKFEKYQKIPTGYLIESLGLKGKTMGGVKVSDQHANYIVNVDNGTAEQAIMLISFVKQQVRDHYGIQLQEEVQLVGLD